MIVHVKRAARFWQQVNVKVKGAIMTEVIGLAAGLAVNRSVDASLLRSRLYCAMGES